MHIAVSNSTSSLRNGNVDLCFWKTWRRQESQLRFASIASTDMFLPTLSQASQDSSLTPDCSSPSILLPNANVEVARVTIPVACVCTASCDVYSTVRCASTHSSSIRIWHRVGFTLLADSKSAVASAEGRSFAQCDCHVTPNWIFCGQRAQRTALSL